MESISTPGFLFGLDVGTAAGVHRFVVRTLVRDPDSSTRHARHVAETRKLVVRLAKATAAKGWHRCGLVTCLYGPNHDWRSWIGKKHFVLSGVRPHVCVQCATQRRQYHAEKLRGKSKSERRVQHRDINPASDDASLTAADQTKLSVGHTRRKMRK